MTITDLYNHHLSVPSDINEHLPILYEFAKKSKHITEFGTRTGVSTLAFLNAALSNKAKMIAYDIKKLPEVEILETLSLKEGIDFTFKEKNVLEITIEPTELLFIDTFHSYNQLKEELRLHSSSVSKYLIFHDTETFGKVGEDNSEGLLKAIELFIKENSIWELAYNTDKNNGLMILKKT